MNFGTLTLFKVVLDSNTAKINGGGLNTQPSGVSRLFQSTVSHNTSLAPEAGYRTSARPRSTAARCG